jgi:hypothetical protein
LNGIVSQIDAALMELGAADLIPPSPSNLHLGKSRPSITEDTVVASATQTI